MPKIVSRVFTTKACHHKGMPRKGTWKEVGLSDVEFHDGRHRDRASVFEGVVYPCVLVDGTRSDGLTVEERFVERMDV